MTQKPLGIDPTDPDIYKVGEFTAAGCSPPPPTQVAPCGYKADVDKPPLALLPGHVIADVAAALAHGADKYGADNWRQGIAVRRLLSAALRHIFAFNDGHDFDPETHLCHLAHAICMLIFALETVKWGDPALDDRFKLLPESEEAFG